jgi:predicted permease
VPRVDFREELPMRHVLQDLRFGLRLLGRSPGFAAAAVLLLGLGIGANTAVFTLVDAVLLRPLPVPAPRELLLLRWSSGPRLLPESVHGYLDTGGESGEASSTSFSYPAFLALREAGKDVVDAMAFAEADSLSLKHEGSAGIARAQLVSGSFFSTLGLRPAIGRDLGDVEGDDTAAASAVLGHRLWKDRFHGDSTVLGATIHLNGAPFTIVGVAPPDFRGTLQVGSEPDLYLPLAARPLISARPFDPKDASTWWVQILARLRPGATPEQVQARLEPAFRQAALLGVEARAAERDLPRLRIEDGSRGLPEARRDFRLPLTLVSAMVAMVLLVACANLASLMLAQAEGRRREMAVRAALGAGRRRLAAQVLTEALLLACLGGALGFLLAMWGTEAAAALLPVPQSTAGIPLEPDRRAFLFAAAVSALVAGLFGLAPALRAGRAAPVADLKAGDETRGSRRLGFGGVLIVSQVALSLVLVTGAGLFVRSLQNLQRIDPGFDPGDLLLFRIDPSQDGVAGERLAALYLRLAERLEALPGVRRVTFARHALLENSAMIARTVGPGREGEPAKATFTWILLPRWNFLQTMGIPILRGRGLEPADERAGARVAVINESLARRLFGDADPIGLGFSQADAGAEPPLLVVGVARDAHYHSLRDDPPPTYYAPYTMKLELAGQMTFAVRAARDPAALLPAVRAAVAEVAPGLPVFGERTQAEQIERLLLRERQFAVLGAVFGSTALLLACIGLFGVLSHAIRRRRREIGIRLALGASPSGVLGMVLRQGLLLTGAGILLGLAGATAASRLVTGMLFVLAPSDPATLAVAVATLLAVAGLSAWLPARRAARTDPMAVLRHE